MTIKALTINKRFELDGAHYSTDANTLSVLRSAVDSYRTAGSVDVSAVAALMHVGIATGRIVPDTNSPPAGPGFEAMTARAQWAGCDWEELMIERDAEADIEQRIDAAWFEAVEYYDPPTLISVRDDGVDGAYVPVLFA